MSFLKVLEKLAQLIPSVEEPKVPLTFEEKLKYTFLVVLIYFILSGIYVFGLNIEKLKGVWWGDILVLLGGGLGTLVSLGIGPIVMAYIILQLLVGGEIIKLDLTKPEDRAKFNTYLKSFIFIFIILEALAQTLFWFRPAIESVFLIPIVFLQIAFGGFLIVLLDDFCTKWGITSGVNLFILCAVSKSFIIRLYELIFKNIIPEAISGDIYILGCHLAALIFTFLIFFLAAYLQSLEIELPITLFRGKGHSFRFPIKFLYTSVIPVILLYAFWVNFRLIASFIGGSVREFFLTYFVPPNLFGGFWGGTSPTILTFDLSKALNCLIYLLYYTLGGAFFSYLWVYSAGMDPKSIAKQLSSLGAQVVGYKRDPRMLEEMLERYIKPCAILGGAAVGFLAGICDTLGTVISGISILLAIVIAYHLYEELKRERAFYFIPFLEKLTKK